MLHGFHTASWSASSNYKDLGYLFIYLFITLFCIYLEEQSFPCAKWKMSYVPWMNRNGSNIWIFVPQPLSCSLVPDFNVKCHYGAQDLSFFSLLESNSGALQSCSKMGESMEDEASASMLVFWSFAGTIPAHKSLQRQLTISWTSYMWSW